MKIKLENLRTLVKQALSETYYGTSPAGGLASTAFNKVGPNIEAGVEIPIDPVDLAAQIRALIGGDAGHPIGDWGDEAFNAAAEIAADALINTNQREKIENATTLYEHKTLLREAINIVEDLESNVNMEHLTSAFDRIIKILDSIDMSLDLLYGAVSGETGPIAGTKFKQKYLGRTISARKPESAEPK